MTKFHAIYVLLDENQSVFYVGKTNNPRTRFRRHLGHVRNGSHYPVHNKIRKVLQLVDKKSVYRVIETGIPENEIDGREMYYIDFYRKQGLKLKNLTNGGEGGKGFTAESQKLAALKRVGQKRSEETKRKISQVKKGVKLSDEHKAALKNAWKTRTPMGSDHYKRISQLNRGVVNIKKYEALSPDGICFITERGLTEFCRNHNLTASNLHKTLIGDRPHHKGWRLLREIKSA